MIDYSWIAYDPFRTYFNHPYLPAGYDSVDNNGDDMNGSGINWPIWPELMDTFVGLQILIITQEMMDVFVEGCPDYAPPCVDSTITFPEEVRVHPVRKVG